MTITELIKQLEEVKREHGDITLKTILDDGHSSWCGDAKVIIQHAKRWPLKTSAWIISVSSCY